MKPEGGSFTMGMANTVLVPANWAARVVAYVIPNHWHKIVPSKWVGRLHVSGQQTKALRYDASAEDIQAALNELPQIGGGAVVRPAEPGAFTIEFTGGQR